MNKTKTLEYHKENDRITLNIYDGGFLLSKTDITDAVLTLALEKLYDDYGLEQGDELHITKKIKSLRNEDKSLGNITKIKLKK